MKIHRTPYPFYLKVFSLIMAVVQRCVQAPLSPQDRFACPESKINDMHVRPDLA